MIKRSTPLRRTPLKRTQKPIKRTAIKKRSKVKRPDGYADPEYLEWLRNWPCLVCSRSLAKAYGWNMDVTLGSARRGFATVYQCGPTQAAHVGLRGLLQKSKDREAIPLGMFHHEHQTAGGGPESHHTLGRKFWGFHGLDRKKIIETLNRLYHEETGK